jgi:hypothetical protein
MKSSSPQIGFDRFIKLEWASIALRIRAGIASLDDLEIALDSSHGGTAAKKKTRTVLNRLWLEPHADFVNFANRGIEIFCQSPNTSAPILTWGMALAVYPFFGKVAEIVGRLTMLQGNCTSAEVHRRMAEIYGEREGTRRMTNMVLQSQADWGGINRTKNGKKIARKNAINLENSAYSSWIVEACVRYSARAVRVGSIECNPVIYPFFLGESIAYQISKSKTLETRVDSSGNYLVGLAE